MTEYSVVQITFGLSDPDLEDDERLRFSKQVLPELRNLDEAERADRPMEIRLGFVSGSLCKSFTESGVLVLDGGARCGDRDSNHPQNSD